MATYTPPLLRLEVTLEEAEILEEALDSYRRSIIADLDGEPTLVQEQAINLATTIGRALRVSVDKHTARARKSAFGPKKRR